MSNPKRFLSRWWLLLALLSLAIVAVGCGGTTTAPVEPAATAVPASTESMSPTEAAVATAVPVEPPAEAPVNPGKLTLLTGSFGNERFDRAIGSGGNTHIGRLLGGFLSGTNRDNEVLPGIATGWRFSTDGRTLTYTIREGVKFHDGTELTAEDVGWTLRHAMSPEAIEAGVPLRGTGRRLSAAMEKVELTAPNEVSLTGIKPLPQLTEQLSEAGTSWFHMLPKRDEIWNEEEAAAYDRKPIAAGPLVLVKHTPAFAMEFERFGDYYYHPDNGLPEDHRVKFESLDLFLVPEEATRVAALEAGDADIIPAGLASRRRVESSGGRYVFARSGAAHNWLVLRVRPARFEPPLRGQACPPSTGLCPAQRTASGYPVGPPMFSRLKAGMLSNQVPGRISRRLSPVPLTRIKPEPYWQRPAMPMVRDSSS